VVCVSCSATEPRASYQERLLQANPKFYSQEVLSKDTCHLYKNSMYTNILYFVARVDDYRVSRPDGDAELIVDYSKFNTPPCLKCGGVVKPGTKRYLLMYH
jgi:hypothetical protein